MDENQIVSITKKEIFQRPNPKARFKFNHYDISEPNHMHEIDILYLPWDTTDQESGGTLKKSKDPKKTKSLGLKGVSPFAAYRYALTLVDCASRYKASRPLKDRSAKTTLTALQDIYARDGNIKKPQWLAFDQGKEFDNKLLRDWAKKEKIQLKVQEIGFHLPFVESFNHILAVKLFRPLQEKEIDTGELQREWVNGLQKTVKDLNDTKTQLIKMTPAAAIKLKEVPQPKNKFTEEDTQLHYFPGEIVRRLLKPDEILDTATNTIKVESRRRATDPYFTIDLYEVLNALQSGEKSLWLHSVKNLNTNEVFGTMLNYFQLRQSEIRFDTPVRETPKGETPFKPHELGEL